MLFNMLLMLLVACFVAAPTAVFAKDDAVVIENAAAEEGDDAGQPAKDLDEDDMPGDLDDGADDDDEELVASTGSHSLVENFSFEGEDDTDEND